MRAPDLDLGSGHVLRFSVWDPDLDLNPEVKERVQGLTLPATIGAIVSHRKNGDSCDGFIYFDVPPAHWFNSESVGKQYWKVEKWDPLTLSPSLLCHCGDHGFIREGRWVLA
jgi:hypothetical protein